MGSEHRRRPALADRDRRCLFANAGGGDFHLVELCSGQECWTSQMAPPAFRWPPRKAGPPFDIGAYEFGASGGDYNRDGSVTAADYICGAKHRPERHSIRRRRR